MLVSEIYGKKLDRTKPLSPLQFKALAPSLDLAISKYLNKARIYRGTRREDNIVYTDPTTQPRVSANTKNYYTMLISSGTLPSWKNWPPRDKALICSGDFYTSAGYSYMGDPYVVLPIGNPKIAVASNADFWDSFQLPLNRLNNYIEKFYNELAVAFNAKHDVHIADELPDKSLEEFMLGIHHIEQMVDSDPELAETIFSKTDRMYYAEMKYLKGVLTSGDIVGGLDNFLNPTNAGFKLTDLENYTKTEKEVWFSATAVLIRPEALNQILSEIR